MTQGNRHCTISYCTRLPPFVATWLPRPSHITYKIAPVKHFSWMYTYGNATFDDVEKETTDNFKLRFLAKH